MMHRYTVAAGIHVSLTCTYSVTLLLTHTRLGVVTRGYTHTHTHGFHTLCMDTHSHTHTTHSHTLTTTHDTTHTHTHTLCSMCEFVNHSEFTNTDHLADLDIATELTL